MMVMLIVPRCTQAARWTHLGAPVQRTGTGGGSRRGGGAVVAVATAVTPQGAQRLILPLAMM
jgi:hypothetical protein